MIKHLRNWRQTTRPTMTSITLRYYSSCETNATTEYSIALKESKHYDPDVETLCGLKSFSATLSGVGLCPMMSIRMKRWANMMDTNCKERVTKRM